MDATAQIAALETRVSQLTELCEALREFFVRLNDAQNETAKLITGERFAIGVLADLVGEAHPELLPEWIAKIEGAAKVAEKESPGSGAFLTSLANRLEERLKGLPG